MAKLAEILARELKEWPEGLYCIVQEWDKELYKANDETYFGGGAAWYRGDGYFQPRLIAPELAEDWRAAKVTRAQWEAERARIAANQQATTEAQEIPHTGSMTNEEQGLAAIACGKRSKEDQVMWDKVAVACYAAGCGVSSDSQNDLARRAFIEADAFMVERAKRMKGGV